MRGRSTTRLVQSRIDIKSWIARTPSPEEVRPAACPCCEVAARPVDGGLRLRGHGLRARQVRGCVEVGAEASEGTVMARRYRCAACGAVILVVPRGLARRRLFALTTIALVLMRWGVEMQSTRRVRQECNPLRHIGESAAEGWASVRRWVRAAASGALFRGLRPMQASETLRGTAARVAMALSALAPPSLGEASLAAQVFAGAALAA